MVTDGDSTWSMDICATEVIIGCFSHCSKLCLITTLDKIMPPMTTKIQMILLKSESWRSMKLTPWIEEVSQNPFLRFESTFSFFSLIFNIISAIHIMTWCSLLQFWRLFHFVFAIYIILRLLSRNRFLARRFQMQCEKGITLY